MGKYVEQSDLDMARDAEAKAEQVRDILDPKSSGKACAKASEMTIEAGLPADSSFFLCRQTWTRPRRLVMPIVSSDSQPHSILNRYGGLSLDGD